MWQEILTALFAILKLFYNFTKDWGLAIILMTIVFRILVWPLMTKQVKSTVGMQKLQPLMKEVQEKYADDKQKQSEEMMKLYKEQKVSPLSGCLPMILQLPLLFAFYSMLSIAHWDKTKHLFAGGGPLYRFLGGTTHHLADKAAPFLNFIHLPGVKAAGFLPDIMTTPDMVLKAHGGWGHIWGALPALWPYLLVVVLFALGSLIPMLMMPGGNSQNKSMGAFMSIFMLVIAFQIPAGALLYYVASTMFAVGQQAFVQKRMEAEEEEEIAEIIAAEDDGKKKGKNKNGNKALAAGDDSSSKPGANSAQNKGKSGANSGAKSNAKAKANTNANSGKGKNTNNPGSKSGAKK
ncbi:MAG: YidC/Oxa1 family membrane protein insertase [Coriobacteriia bacterium]|nr:YidC/Oxa1 family membrane protein insertase [Coriobacteriia bacterium]